MHASQLYARNVSNLLLLMTTDGRVEPDWYDENSTETLHIVLGLTAVLLATLNLVGGFVVTDRMLEMFGRGRKPPPPRTADETAEPRA